MLLGRDYSPLLARVSYGNCYGYNCNSNWYQWGRWILAGVLIFIGFCVLLFVLFLNRRRRRRGMGRIHPRIGMGRRANQMESQPPQSQVPYGGGGVYNQNMGYQQYAPPPGAPPQYGSGLNADYYGQHQGVSQPENAYQPPHIK